MLKIHRNSRGFSAIEGLFVLIVIALVGLMGWYIWQKHTTKHSIPAKINSSVTHSSTPGSSYLTYDNNGSSSKFYVGTPAGKIIAQTMIPSADNFSYVYARNEQGLILETTKQESAYTGHADSNYVLVGFDGTTRNLSSSVASTLTDALNNAALDGTDQLFYATCDDTSSNCSLNSVNLSSGSTATYMTESGIPVVGGVSSPFTVLGASDNIVYYEHSAASGPSQLIAYNIATRKETHSYNLQTAPIYPPDLSPDNKYAVYVSQNNSAGYVLDLANESMKTFSISNWGGINANYQSAFLWSPNDDNIEFTSPTVGLSTSTPVVSVNIYDLQTGRVSSVKTFGDPRYTDTTAYSWLSNTELFYSTDKTSLANDFDSPYDTGAAYAGLNVQSGDMISNPIPSKYTYVTPEPDL